MRGLYPMRDAIHKYWVFVLIPVIIVALLVIYAGMSSDSSVFAYDV